MHPTRIANFLTLALAVSLAGIFLPPPAPASAHEHRHVGKYEFTIGFLTEPALEGEPNGIDLTVIDSSTNRPVEGLDKTLKATAAFGGGQPREFPLRARFNMPGKYAADFVPTRSGSYVFTITGDVGGQAINERFESGPGRFNDVQRPAYFPAADPTNAELAQALSEARQQAVAANTMAMAGLASGLLGLLLAGYLLLTRRSAAAPRAAETPLASGSRAD